MMTQYKAIATLMMLTGTLATSNTTKCEKEIFMPFPKSFIEEIKKCPKGRLLGKNETPTYLMHYYPEWHPLTKEWEKEVFSDIDEMMEDDEMERYYNKIYDDKDYRTMCYIMHVNQWYLPPLKDCLLAIRSMLTLNEMIELKKPLTQENLIESLRVKNLFPRNPLVIQNSRLVKFVLKWYKQKKIENEGMFGQAARTESYVASSRQAKQVDVEEILKMIDDKRMGCPETLKITDTRIQTNKWIRLMVEAARPTEEKKKKAMRKLLGALSKMFKNRRDFKQFCETQHAVQARKIQQASKAVEALAKKAIENKQERIQQKIDQWKSTVSDDDYNRNVEEVMEQARNRLKKFKKIEKEKYLIEKNEKEMKAARDFVKDLVNKAKQMS